MPPEKALSHRRIMIVEDEFLIAAQLTDDLGDLGAETLGPFYSLKSALDSLTYAPKAHAAVLDINLGGQMVFPLAEKLVATGVPIVFASGYSDLAIPQGFSAVPRFSKPVDVSKLAITLLALTADPLAEPNA
jgi:DNA-binding LytR/AlgR family response regulator